MCGPPHLKENISGASVLNTLNTLTRSRILQCSPGMIEGKNHTCAWF
jgi:hypothetical protein